MFSLLNKPSWKGHLKLVLTLSVKIKTNDENLCGGLHPHACSFLCLSTAPHARPQNVQWAALDLQRLATCGCWACEMPSVPMETCCKRKKHT